MSAETHDIHVYILVDISVRVSDNSRHSTTNTFTEIINKYNTWPVSTLLVELATATAIVVVIVLYTDYHK